VWSTSTNSLVHEMFIFGEQIRIKAKPLQGWTLLIFTLYFPSLWKCYTVYRIYDLGCGIGFLCGWRVGTFANRLTVTFTLRWLCMYSFHTIKLRTIKLSSFSDCQWKCFLRNQILSRRGLESPLFWGDSNHSWRFEMRFQPDFYRFSLDGLAAQIGFQTLFS